MVVVMTVMVVLTVAVLVCCWDISRTPPGP